MMATPEHREPVRYRALDSVWWSGVRGSIPWLCGMALGLLLELAVCSGTVAPVPGYGLASGSFVTTVASSEETQPAMISRTGSTISNAQQDKARSRALHLGRNGPLTDVDMAMVRTAWKYFENNSQPDTGLVNSVHGYPSATMWDTASYMGGLMAVYELGVVAKNEFDQRLSAL